MATILRRIKGKYGQFAQLKNTGSPRLNSKCKCGSGKKYKKCCGIIKFEEEVKVEEPKAPTKPLTGLASVVAVKAAELLAKEG